MKKLKDMGEYAVHATIANVLNKAIGHHVVGDDAAVIDLEGSDKVILISTDRLAAGVPEHLRARLLTVQALSDVACMGGRPLAMVVAVQIQREASVDELINFISGIEDEVESYGCHLIGGDTKEGPEFTAVGTVVALAERDALVTRSGGRPGDIVAVTLSQGKRWGARWAYHLVRKYSIPLHDAMINELATADIEFTFPAAEARALARGRFPTAGLDLSDGLGAGAAILARASGVRIDINQRLTRELVDPNLQKVCDAVEVPLAALAWSPGYMWENLYTIGPADIERATNAVAATGGRLLTVGRVYEGAGVTIDGETSDVPDIASDEKFREWPWEDRTEHWVLRARASGL